MKRSAEQASGEHHYSPDQGEHSVDGDPNQPEWQQQKPHDGIEDQGQQSQRPAENEEKAPEQESEHGRPPYAYLRMGREKSSMGQVAGLRKIALNPGP
jgi:hypothetical protein